MQKYSIKKNLRYSGYTFYNPKLLLDHILNEEL